MTEHPILFSAPMIRAILDGRKTQTRRVVKFNASHRVQLKHHQWHIEDPLAILACPYGKVGDRLWVRETWCAAYQDGAWGTLFRADETFALGKQNHPKGPYYHAKEFGTHIHWRPSIFMPRWASRITLEITDVRVQRVQEIGTNDCYEEGIERPSGPILGSERCGYDNARNDYRRLWDSINAKRGFAWSVNPWIWAITFTVLASDVEALMRPEEK